MPNQENGPAWRKSTYSGYNGNCVEVGWGGSSHSNGSNCVETRSGECGLIHVRDSKDPHGPALAFTPQAWQEFTGRIKAAGA